jgi:hypothetical protein
VSEVGSTSPEMDSQDGTRKYPTQPVVATPYWTHQRTRQRPVSSYTMCCSQAFSRSTVCCSQASCRHTSATKRAVAIHPADPQCALARHPAETKCTASRHIRPVKLKNNFKIGIFWITLKENDINYFYKWRY